MRLANQDWDLSLMKGIIRIFYYLYYDSLLSGDVFSKQLLLINNQLITKLIFFSIRNHSFASRYKQPILQTMNKGKNNFCASYVSCKHI